VKKKFTRREVLGVGLGAAALATSGSAINLERILLKEKQTIRRN